MLTKVRRWLLNRKMVSLKRIRRDYCGILFHYVYKILFSDVDNKDRFSQNITSTPGGLSRKTDSRYSTPTSNTDSTPKRTDRYLTSTRSTDSTDTPLRKIQKMNYQTPSKSDVKMTPVNIAEMLNDDDFTDFMDIEMDQS